MHPYGWESIQRTSAPPVLRHLRRAAPPLMLSPTTSAPLVVRTCAAACVARYTIHSGGAPPPTCGRPFALATVRAVWPVVLFFSPLPVAATRGGRLQVLGRLARAAITWLRLASVCNSVGGMLSKSKSAGPLAVALCSPLQPCGLVVVPLCCCLVTLQLYEDFHTAQTFRALFCSLFLLALYVYMYGCVRAYIIYGMRTHAHPRSTRKSTRPHICAGTPARGPEGAQTGGRWVVCIDI